MIISNDNTAAHEGSPHPNTTPDSDGDPDANYDYLRDYDTLYYHIRTLLPWSQHCLQGTYKRTNKTSFICLSDAAFSMT